MIDNELDNNEKEYEEVLNEYFKVSDEIEHIEQYKIIKKYLELKKKQRDLDIKETKLYKQRLLRRYTDCNHILVETNTEVDRGYGGKTYHYYGCIKCGLDEAVIEREYGFSREESMMIKVAKENDIHSIYGLTTGIKCDLDDARDLYNEIIERYPDLDDENIVEIFKNNYKNYKIIVKSLRK